MQTVLDVDKAFRLYVDKAGSQGSADFLPGERERFLNDAQLRLARMLTSAKSDNQDNVDLRRSLSRPLEVVLSNGLGTLPADYLHYGRCMMSLLAPYANYSVKLSVVSEDELSDALDNTFNKPTIGAPVACFLSGTLATFPAHAGSKVTGQYYALPTPVSLATPTQVPDICEALIPTWVQYAVQLALESTESARTSSQAQISTLTAL